MERRARADFYDQTAGADLKELASILSRNRGVIAAFVGTALIIGIGYLIATPKLYTADIEILYNSVPRPPVGSSDAFVAPQNPDPALVESQVELISSDAVLRRVVRTERLSEDPEFGPKKPGILGNLLSAFEPGSNSAAPGSVVAEDRTVAALARAVEVKRSEQTYVLELDVSAWTPAKAARLANAVANAYLEEQQAAKQVVVETDSNLLDQRLNDLQGRLKAADDKVSEFKIANGIADANGKNVAQQELSDLATELAQARAQTEQTQARAAEVAKIEASGSLPDGTSTALQSPTLAQLREQYAALIEKEADARMTYGAHHPALLAIEAQARDAQSQIQDELRRIARAAQTDYQIAKANEAGVERRLEAARKGNDLKNKALAELSDLQHDADAARTVYVQFLRAREMITSEASAGPTARILAPAAPPLTPSSPKKTIVLALSLFVGLLFGAGAAFARDFVHREDGPLAPRRDAEIIAEIAPILRRGGVFARLKDWAMRPRVQLQSAIQEEDPLTESATRPDSAFSRSIAALWRGVAPRDQSATLSRARAWTILVASLSSGAGKTTIAANLARRAAESGARVLLIDANPADPALSRLIDQKILPHLIKVSETERVAFKLWKEKKGALTLLPILPSEARVVRRLRSRLGIPVIDGLDGHFDVVVFDGPSADDPYDLRDLIRTADRVVLAVSAEERADVDLFVEDFDVSSRQMEAGLLALVPARPERA